MSGVDHVADGNHLCGGWAEDGSQEQVEVCDSGADLDEEEDHVGLVDGQEDLAADLVFENILRVDGVSSGADYGEFASVSVGFSVMAASGRFGRLRDVGLSLID